ncbi:MAG: pyridoxal phosphate-dependent aminotransferase [Lentimicrobiaceae bacterium]|nr:pyridoxal phosphate-dependent aminotransferase [Lentimicrobiaceae bacterium]
MPTISKKGQVMPPSPIRKLVPFADAAKQRGVKVFHLNIGQPDVETPKCALDAVKNNNLKVIEYSHSAGNLSYRKKLVEYYKKVGIDITPDEIIITNGGSEAILFAFNTCLNPEDEVIIPEPFYANYNGFAISCGVKVKPIVSSIKTGFSLPEIEEFEKIITPKTKAIMICNPNNPTGYLYSKEEIEKLGHLAEKYDLFLFADEVYREFCYDGEKHFSVMELKHIDQHVVLMDSVSKRYSACGVRVGCFISKNKEVMATALKFAQARLSPPTYGQILGEAACETPQSYFDEVVREYVARRNCVVDAINKMPGCFCPNPKGAFYAVASLPIDDADKFCQWLLESFNYNGKTVMLAPATGFYSYPAPVVNEVRISYVLNVNDLKEAMECLAEAVKVYSGRR